MNTLLGTPEMIREARATGKGRHWILELLAFILVFLVVELIETLLMWATFSWVERELNGHRQQITELSTIQVLRMLLS